VTHQVSCLLLVCVFFQIVPVRHAFAQAEPHILPPYSTISMPFDLREDFLIVVEGRIGPIEHLRFILDTGSSRTIVSQKIADQFTLSRQPALLIALGNKRKLESAIFPEVQIGPLRVLNQPMIVGNLAKVSEFATNVDAILGLDILSRCKALEIDYAAREVRFVNPHSASDEGHASVNAFFVPATLERRSIRLLVDTGMQGVVLFEGRLRSHVGKWESTEKVSALMGSSRIQQVRLPSLWLGPFQINAPVFILPGKRSAVPEVMDGALGPRALGATRIALDFDDMKLRFR
jgi:predicted aspartyl protease